MNKVMMKLLKSVKNLLRLLLPALLLMMVQELRADPAVTSTKEEAVNFLLQIKQLDSSSAWPYIKPAAFLKNLQSNINDPVGIYPGNGTNFCGYGALTYLFLLDDPLGYAKLQIELYRNGKAGFKKVNFEPSEAVRKAAGTLRFKGILDIHPAEQLWFLTLADHYKGYLNFFNRKYDPGDEDRFWASVNYAKFNRMIRSLLHFKLEARGTDLLRPRIKDLYTYISTRLPEGKVVLYVNNRIIHKKNHIKLKLGVPTHFVVAEKISLENDVITLVYWDYGGRTLLQLSPAFFKRIVFGVTYCTKKVADEK